MKSRILPVMGLTFGVLLLSRTAALSSEITPDKSTQAIGSTIQALDGNHDSQNSIPDQKDGLFAETDAHKNQCLTGAILETLSADMERLENRKLEISKRESALTAIETKLATQMQAIEKTNAALDTKIATLKGLANDDLKHLVSMYQTMKPKQASEIFNSMDPSFAAGFLREMNSDKAGLIMANMDARKSYAISVIIAGQNAKYRSGK